MVKILIIEDNKDLLDFICALLYMHQFEVSGVTTGKEFKTQLKSFLPDLVIMDVILIKEDGRDLCREFKKEHKNIPVILISANAKLLIDYKGCKADDIIEKPFNIADILKKINDNLQLSTL
jgi:twitching motility two-component system response regulator PilH